MRFRYWSGDVAIAHTDIVLRSCGLVNVSPLFICPLVRLTKAVLMFSVEQSMDFSVDSISLTS